MVAALVLVSSSISVFCTTCAGFQLCRRCRSTQCVVPQVHSHSARVSGPGTAASPPTFSRPCWVYSPILALRTASSSRASRKTTAPEGKARGPPGSSNSRSGGYKRKSDREERPTNVPSGRVGVVSGGRTRARTKSEARPRWGQGGRQTRAKPSRGARRGPRNITSAECRGAALGTDVGLFEIHL